MAANGKQDDEKALETPDGAKDTAPAEETAAEATTEARSHVPPVTEEQEVAAKVVHAEHAKHPEAHGAAWGEPIARFERAWTRLEQRLITFVLLWQLAALVAWVFLNGLSESVSQSAGMVFRAVGGAVIFGLAAWFGAKKAPEDRRRAITIAAIFVGLAIGPIWRKAVLGSPEGGLASLDKSIAGYFDNMKGWLQEGSTLTLLGGLRGLGTRLTLWLALLGGSLATATGKHIHVDVIYRFLPKKLRVPAALINYTAAAMVCFAGTWGFFDHVAIESYGSKADDTAGQKISHAAHEIDDHLFFTRKQLGLDLKALPHVLTGERYDRWLSADAWNAWIDEAGFKERFKEEEVQTIKVPSDAGPHVPLVLSPAGETTRGILVHTLGLVFPFGLIAIGLRFLLRAILTLSGHISADPDEAHKEDLKSAARNDLSDATVKGGA